MARAFLFFALKNKVFTKTKSLICHAFQIKDFVFIKTLFLRAKKIITTQTTNYKTNSSDISIQRHEYADV
jgi:hypothetical protein